MTPAKKNGPSPCRTQPGEIRRVRYHALYSSADAAEFANVPKATVYHAMREGRLKTQSDVPGHPRIEHTELLRWMEERGFPVPLDGGGPRPPKPDALVPLLEAAREASVDPDDLRQAIAAGLVPASRQKRIRRVDLTAWITKGRPLPAPLPPPLGSRQLRLLERMVGGEVLRRSYGDWSIGGQCIALVTVRPLTEHRLVQQPPGRETARITPAGWDALRAHQTGRSVPTRAERTLLLRLRQGPLTRDPIDRENAVPSEKRVLNAEESCLSRGWAEWRDGVLYATDLGRRVPWRQPKAR